MVGTGCYFFIFKEDKSWANMMLQIFFIAQAIYGWVNWSETNTKSVTLSDNMAISIQLSAIMFGITFLYAINELYIFKLSRLDITTTTISVCALYLTAKKKLESWGYWGFVNVLYIILFIQGEHWLSAALYTIFLINAYLGYKEWKKSIKAHMF
jgi:nicotinamide mononucleotide transporter